MSPQQRHGPGRRRGLPRSGHSGAAAKGQRVHSVSSSPAWNPVFPHGTVRSPQPGRGKELRKEDEGGENYGGRCGHNQSFSFGHALSRPAQEAARSLVLSWRRGGQGQGPARTQVRIAASCSQPTPYIHPAKDEKAERRQRRMPADRQTTDAGRAMKPAAVRATLCLNPPDRAHTATPAVKSASDECLQFPAAAQFNRQQLVLR